MNSSRMGSEDMGEETVITLKKGKHPDMEPVFLAEYCRQRGYPVVEEVVTIRFEDKDTPELKALLRDIEEGKLDVV